MGHECETTTATLLEGVCRLQTRPNLGEACENNRPFWCEGDAACKGSQCVAFSNTGDVCSRNDDCLTNSCDGMCFDRVTMCQL
jgi:hypothetical protein